MRKKGGFKSILIYAIVGVGCFVLGVAMADKVKPMLSKLPVVGKFFAE